MLPRKNCLVWLVRDLGQSCWTVPLVKIIYHFAVLPDCSQYEDQDGHRHNSVDRPLQTHQAGEHTRLVLYISFFLRLRCSTSISHFCQLFFSFWMGPGFATRKNKNIFKNMIFSLIQNCTFQCDGYQTLKTKKILSVFGQLVHPLLIRKLFKFRINHFL